MRSASARAPLVSTNQSSRSAPNPAPLFLLDPPGLESSPRSLLHRSWTRFCASAANDTTLRFAGRLSPRVAPGPHRDHTAAAFLGVVQEDVRIGVERHGLASVAKLRGELRHRD